MINLILFLLLIIGWQFLPPTITINTSTATINISIEKISSFETLVLICIVIGMIAQALLAHVSKTYKVNKEKISNLQIKVTGAILLVATVVALLISLKAAGFVLTFIGLPIGMTLESWRQVVITRFSKRFKEV